MDYGKQLGIDAASSAAHTVLYYGLLCYHNRLRSPVMNSTVIFVTRFATLSST